MLKLLRLSQTVRNELQLADKARQVKFGLVW